MRTRLCFGVLLAGSLAALSAQSGTPQPPQTPTFRAEASYVRVDMYATQNGQPVEDLNASDVDVLEDGAPQTVVAFEHVSVRPAGSSEVRVEPNTVAESRTLAADSRARVFVIFLDTYHTQIEGSAQMRGPLVRFLDRLLGPDDLVALMTPEMSARDLTLGRKTTVISNLMQDQWTWGRRGRIADNDPKEDLYDACYPDSGDTQGIAAEMKNRRREKLTLDALEDLVSHLQGIREERKAVITVTEGWRMAGENRQLARVIDPKRGQPIPDLLPPRRGIDNRTSGGASRVSMTECDADRLALSMINDTTRVRELSERANRGNVTFYPVYARGLAVFDSPIGPERAPSIQQDRVNLAARQDSLRQLALETDGLAVIGSNDIDRGMQRIVADLSSYYLLAYYSNNGKLDGRFRNITVRVKRPGVQVRARRGYRAPTPEELTEAARPTLSGNVPAGVTDAFTAVAGVSPRSQVRVRTAAWPRVAGDQVAGSLWVVGELDYVVRRDVAWSAGASAELVVVSAAGEEVLSKTMDLNVAEGIFTLQLPETGGIAPGEYALRVRIKPKQGTALALSDTARVVVSSTAARLGEAVLWRRGPGTGPRFMTTADPRFMRSERVRLEHATTAAGTATARLLDRLGKPLAVPVTVTERTDQSGEFRWIVAEVALAPMAPGDYAIEVALDDVKQVTGFRVVP